MVERQILVLQRLDVAQHLGFRVIAVEHRVRQERGGTTQRCRNTHLGSADLGVQCSDILTVRGTGKSGQQLVDGGAGGGFIQADTQVIGIDHTQVDAGSAGTLENLTGLARHLQGQGIEEGRVATLDTLCAQAFGQNRGQTLYALGDQLKTLRAVVNGVEAGDVGQQHLRGTDVRVGLLAANVLLTGLQRHTQGAVATGINRDTDDATRHRALVSIAGGEERSVRSAVAHRHAKALRRTEDHVSAQLARRGQHGQRQQVSADTGQTFLRLNLLDQRLDVANFAPGGRVLEQRAEDFVVAQLADVIDHDIEAKGLGAGQDDRDGLRMAVLINEEQVALALGNPLGQRHGFGCGGGFVQQRGAGQFHAGQVDGQLLKVQQ